MAIIKAGTYRFNDVMTHTSTCSADINFTLEGYAEGVPFTVNCSRITFDYFGGDDIEVFYYLESTTPDLGIESGDVVVYGYDEGWRNEEYSTALQNITVLEDTEVSTEFNSCFRVATNSVVAKKFTRLHTGACEASGINGIVREYKVNAGANVNAGDFVEFVTKYGNKQFSTGDAPYTSACKLDDSRVFVAYQDEKSGYGMGVLLNITDGIVSIGKPIRFEDVGAFRISVCTVTSNKVFISYAREMLSGSSLSTFMSIENDELKPEKRNPTGNNSQKAIATCAPSNDKALVLFNDGNDVNISIFFTNEEIYAYTKTLSNGYSSYGKSVATLSENKVLFVCSLHTGVVCGVITISNTSVTFGPKVTVSGIKQIDNAKVVKLTENKAIVIYGGTARVLTIDNTTITFSGEYTLFNGEISSTVALSENKVLVSYVADNIPYGTSQILTINGDDITIGESTVFDYNTLYSSDIIAFSDNSALVVYNNGLGKYSSLSIDDTTITADGGVEGTYVQPATSNLHNVGVAKTSGADGETVEVYQAV